MNEDGQAPGLPPSRNPFTGSPLPADSRSAAHGHTAWPPLLHSSQRLLTDVLKSVADGVVVADLEGRLVLFNASAERILGLGELAVPPSNWSTAYGLFSEDGVTPFPSDELPLARAIRGESVFDCRVCVRNLGVPRGVWLSINAAPLRDDDLGLCGGVAIFRDITASRRELERVELLSAVVEQTADAVVITDSTGLIEYVNPALERTTGYSSRELIGRTPRIFRSGAHTAAFYDELWATLNDGRVFRGTLIDRKKNGEEFHSEQTVTPVRNAAGVVSHFVSVGRDITDRRRAAEADSRHMLARAVQQRLFPVSAPEGCGCDIAGAVYTADKTGGDYYDFLELPDGCTGLVVGDVSGHAFDAALFMAETRAYVRSIAQATSDPGAILTMVNRALVVDTADNQFVTLFLCCLDRNRRGLRYASAGHVTGIVLDYAGAVKAELPATGVPLGLFADANITTSAAPSLERGDLIALFSDGVTDADTADGLPFGMPRALDVVRAHQRESAARIVHQIYQAVRAFTGRRPHTDDITVLICKVEDWD